MELFISHGMEASFVSPNPVCTQKHHSLTLRSNWCPQRFPGRWMLGHQRSRLARKREKVSPVASLANTIVRALQNEFEGKNIDRVVQSFRDVMDGNKLEEGKGTPQHQRAASFVKGLEAVPFYDDLDHPDFKWVRGLEENWTKIAQELKRVTGQEDIHEKGNNIWAPPVIEAANAYGPDWRTLVLQDRVWDPTNSKLFPETVQMLREKDADVPSVEAFFARQSPDTGIRLHTDDCNFILTMHLALSAPDQQSWIEVAGERRYWENGKALVFNTSFFHRTMNESKEEDRIVLLLRFWHPQLTESERQALNFLFQVIDDPESHPAVMRAERQLRSEETVKGKRGMSSSRRSGGRGFAR